RHPGGRGPGPGRGAGGTSPRPRLHPQRGAGGGGASGARGGQDGPSGERSPAPRAVRAGGGRSRLGALLDRPLQLLEDVRRLLLQALHVAGREREEPHLALRDDRCRPLRLPHRADLTEEVAGSQLRDRLTIAVDLGPALEDHEEVVGGVALVHEMLTGVDHDVVHVLGQFLLGVRGKRREQRRFVERGWIHPSPPAGYEELTYATAAAPAASP